MSSIVGCDFHLPEILLIFAIVIHIELRLRAASVPQTRTRRVIYRRIDMKAFMAQYVNCPKFERNIRMRRDSFYKLVELLRRDVQSDENMATRRGGAITPEMCTYLTLRYLAGGSYLDICVHLQISHAAFYYCLYKTLIAICQCKVLDIVFPIEVADCERLASGFRHLSENESIGNCIGAVDGYLLSIETPSNEEAGNVTSYFSGHYQKYGINVQAMCDSRCVFRYFALSAPGSFNDRVAIKQKCKGVSLFSLIEELPEKFVVIADAAYDATEHIVPLFYGSQRHNAAHDNFNYCASQCRIRIEMSFGIMQAKWGILKRPLTQSLKNVKYVVLAIARLHNYVIKENFYEPDTAQVPYQATVPNRRGQGPAHPAPVDSTETYSGMQRSRIRDGMVKYVANVKAVRDRRSVLHRDNLKQK